MVCGKGSHGVFTSRDKKLIFAVRQKDLDRTMKVVSKAKSWRKRAANVDCVDAERDYGEWTPLHHAAYNGSTEIVRFLLEKGANPNALSSLDSGRFSPLHLAAKMNHSDIVDALLANPNTDINVRTICRETPLHIAAKEGSYESLVKIIYTIHKAPNVWFHVDLNAQDDGGNSALHLALLNRNTREAIFLVTKAKINDSIRNYNGRSALDIAEELCLLDYLQALKKWTDDVLGNKIADMELANDRIKQAPVVNEEYENERYRLIHTGMQYDICEEFSRKKNKSLASKLWAKEQCARVNEIRAEEELAKRETLNSRQESLESAVNLLEQELVDRINRDVKLDLQRKLEAANERIRASLAVDMELKQITSEAEEEFAAQLNERRHLLKVVREMECAERTRQLREIAVDECVSWFQRLDNLLLVRELEEQERYRRISEESIFEAAAVAEQRASRQLFKFNRVVALEPSVSYKKLHNKVLQDMMMAIAEKSLNISVGPAMSTTLSTVTPVENVSHYLGMTEKAKEIVPETNLKTKQLVELFESLQSEKDKVVTSSKDHASQVKLPSTATD